MAFHLAAQVSVVNGEKDSLRDFTTNALGTFEVLQWARAHDARVVYSSTNKVLANYPALPLQLPIP